MFFQKKKKKNSIAGSFCCLKALLSTAFQSQVRTGHEYNHFFFFLIYNKEVIFLLAMNFSLCSRQDKVDNSTLVAIFISMS